MCVLLLLCSSLFYSCLVFIFWSFFFIEIEMIDSIERAIRYDDHHSKSKRNPFKWCTNKGNWKREQSVQYLIELSFCILPTLRSNQLVFIFFSFFLHGFWPRYICIFETLALIKQKRTYKITSNSDKTEYIVKVATFN